MVKFINKSRLFIGLLSAIASPFAMGLDLIASNTGSISMQINGKNIPINTNKQLLNNLSDTVNISLKGPSKFASEANSLVSNVTLKPIYKSLNYTILATFIEGKPYGIVTASKNALTGNHTLYFSSCNFPVLSITDGGKASSEAEDSKLCSGINNNYSFFGQSNDSKYNNYSFFGQSNDSKLVSRLRISPYKINWVAEGESSNRFETLYKLPSEAEVETPASSDNHFKFPIDVKGFNGGVTPPCIVSTRTDNDGVQMASYLGNFTTPFRYQMMCGAKNDAVRLEVYDFTNNKVYRITSPDGGWVLESQVNPIWQNDRPDLAHIKLSAQNNHWLNNIHIDSVYDLWISPDKQYLSVNAFNGASFLFTPIAKNLINPYIGIWTAGTSTAKIIASLTTLNKKVYLFYDDFHFERYAIESPSINLNRKSNLNLKFEYAKLVNDKTWPGLSKYYKEISSAVNLGNGSVLFFLKNQMKGLLYIRYDLNQDMIVGTPSYVLKDTSFGSNPVAVLRVE